jgi:site-specific DNA-methyltransferase (adenine-specific)
MRNVCHLADCMDFMRELPDNAYDLAIVDPPYGIARFGDRVDIRDRIFIDGKINGWDIKPPPEYFDELFRVSSKQIIWGANNFSLPQTEYFCIWDKQQTVSNFASAEYAWTNIKQPAQVFRYSIHKEMQNRKKQGGKFHPTQKPVALYKWLLQNYAKPGQTIFDSHVGSGSIRIACHDLGFDFEGCEIDPDYHKAQEERYQRHTAQGNLFDSAEIQALAYGKE